MHFLNVRLENFRNLPFAELNLNASRSFLLGANGQGKSNLLEALGLVTACRSFRTQQMSALCRHATDGYALVYNLHHESLGETVLEMRYDRLQGHQIILDGERISRLGDFIGRFPVVPLSSGDLMLLRGAPSDRRRFLDLTLSAIDSSYYDALRHYHRGVTGRNRLLKSGGSTAELAAFEAELAPYALEIISKRQKGVVRLQKILKDVY
ncbi:MAG TPA: DNA replication and repair protein RecF, partial [Opitutae bacterium]|nr:DNA replication and repair protein RecF [Opitutae bacterium]